MKSSTFSDWLLCLFLISNDRCALKEIYRFRHAFDIAESVQVRVIMLGSVQKQISYNIQHTNGIFQIIFKQTIEPFK